MTQMKEMTEGQKKRMEALKEYWAKRKKNKEAEEEKMFGFGKKKEEEKNG